MPNTFAPDSVADSTIFGVCTSVKPRPSMASRKPAALAAAISNPAFSTGCRSVVGAWSSTVGRPAVTVGRYRSKGGGAAGRGQRRDHRPGDLHAARRLGAGRDRPGDLDYRLFRKVLSRPSGAGGGRDHGLGQARAVS